MSKFEGNNAMIANLKLKSEYYPLMRDKIGNFLIYFCQGKDIPLSFALKLLFLVDETSVRETGVPITFIDYYAYKKGPVAHDIHYVIKTEEKQIPIPESIKLSPFIETFKTIEKVQTSSHYRIKPKKEFDELVCTEYEISILAKVIKKYGKSSASRLSTLTHEKGSLWDVVRENNNLDEYFELNNCQHSDFPIHFTSLIDTDAKKRAYQNAKFSLEYTSEF